MVHSVEALFDDATETAVRELWDGLAAAGVPSQAGHTAPSNRPHVTLTVAEQMDDAVDVALAPLLDRLPLPCVVGAPMLFGGGRTVTLVRLVVPSAGLLALHAGVHESCLPHVPKGVLPHVDPGRWTPHVTLGRSIPPDLLPLALAIPGIARDIHGEITTLRHWDGNAKQEHWI
ncbi:2'-5' RNA ligase family protein [Mycolicibacterium sp. 018/SC-01/001]|uniref:2'-5' RNA ligase family protein n=1 Tax=Mycolicibacterium sp. 018/SC-01/001 TaxID=2592069 RepID=UPI00117EAE93|nr:2'-5' RNA ligase family protein [Mycolicibacterium sp. 018/SC-01/001]TRW83265.1 2'-5' RNA ligase family protein [Mycolicibacterium sp. 018/SC-01/001]